MDLLFSAVKPILYYLPLLLCIACRPYTVRELVTSEVKVGTCATQLSRVKCESSSIPYKVGTSITSLSSRDEKSFGVSVFYKPRFYLFQVDQRALRRSFDKRRFESLAMGTGIQYNLFSPWQTLSRWIHWDLEAGGNLGVIRFDSRFRGRLDGFVGTSVDVFLQNFRNFQYLDQGGPGLHFAVRKNWFVQQWEPETRIEMGLVWHWGSPIELITYSREVTHNTD